MHISYFVGHNSDKINWTTLRHDVFPVSAYCMIPTTAASILVMIFRECKLGFFLFQILKMYAWEPSFIKKVDDARNKELDVMWWRSFWDAAMHFYWAVAPVIVSKLRPPHPPNVFQVIAPVIVSKVRPPPPVFFNKQRKTLFPQNSKTRWAFSFISIGLLHYVPRWTLIS